MGQRACLEDSTNLLDGCGQRRDPRVLSADGFPRKPSREAGGEGLVISSVLTPVIRREL